MSRFARISFRASLLIAAVVPLSLFAVSGAGLLYAAFSVQFEDEARSRLETAAANLTHDARLGVLTRAESNLRQPVQHAIADPDIVYAGVYKIDGGLIFGQGKSAELHSARVSLRAQPGGQRYSQLGSGFRELVRVMRYPREPETPELLGFAPAFDAAEQPLGEPEGIVRLVLSTERQAAGYRRVLVFSGIGIILLLGLGGLIAIALSRGLVNGVEQLAAAARRIALRDHSTPLHVDSVSGGPELETLAHAFNRMGAEIRAYQHDMEKRVAARTVELEAARDEAERANAAKTQFLANMSHELRTPMTAILGYTDLMLEEEDEPLPQIVREQIGIVRRNGNHLLAIVNDVLDLSRIEAGRLVVETLPMSPSRLVAQAASLWRVRASEKGVDLRVRFVGRIPSEIVSDPTRLLQALMNLTSNAIKFTEVGRVEIETRYDPDQEVLAICVSDTGIGIPEDLLGTVFDSFEQIDSSMSRRFGGTGLGLAITRRIAEALGGDCRVSSREGQGSAFTFTCHAPLTEGAQLLSISGDSIVADSAPPRGRPAEEPLRARILIAEDCRDNQHLISRILTRAGAEVAVAENGRVAVERFSEGAFDLILMDMAMPVMDGYEATQELRERGFEAPIVALTAHALEVDRNRCLAIGCTDYLTKPVDRETLLTTIRTALLKSRA